MKTTIDNSTHVFLIQRLGFFTRTYFCNLRDIKHVITTELEKNDQYKIFLIDGIKVRVASKKMLNRMCEVQELPLIF